MSEEKNPVNREEACKTSFGRDWEWRRQIPGAVDSILESFKEPDSRAHLDASPMSDESTIIEIVQLVRAIIFPGYFGRTQIEHHSLNYIIGELCLRVYDLLSVQISRAHKNDCSAFLIGNAECVDCDDYGRKAAVEFLKAIPRLRRLLAKDVLAAYEGDPAAKNFDEIIFCYPGLCAITIFRIAHALHTMGILIIPRIMTEYAHRITGIDIHPGAQIDESFFIDHGTGVVIGETTVIGKNVQIYQGVTLGALRFYKDENGRIIRGTKRHPTIENNVTIYAQATILGGDTVIGEGATVGGNIWLTHSIPPGSLVQNEAANIRLRENHSHQVLDYSI